MKGLFAAALIASLTELGDNERRAWSRRFEQYASEGHKLIGCAWRELEDDWAGGEPDRGYSWAGFLAFEDPVRQGVPEAVHQCHAAGIRVVMVTGDHPTTAAAVAREIGLGPDPRVIAGDDLALLLEHRDRQTLRAVAVIARAVPTQKVGFVRALAARRRDYRRDR